MVSTDLELLIINGPGLSDIEDRSEGPSISAIGHACADLCEALGIGLDYRQSEDEAEVAHWITSDAAHCQALIVNPSGGPSAASADYQVALDALAHLDKPVVEVHLTNIFRAHRKPLQGLSGSAGFVCGLGGGSYLLAIAAVAQQLGVVRAE